MSTSEGSGRTCRKFTPEFKAEIDSIAFHCDEYSL